MTKLQDALLYGFMIFALTTAVAQIQNATVPLINPMLDADSSNAFAAPIVMQSLTTIGEASQMSHRKNTH